MSLVATVLVINVLYSLIVLMCR